ncbi:hypothetical protein Taro_018678 [Colocasia esculenta]|uniref:RING-type domain-containing protein n=1 Tax=Colocasia esculenta TaxID=4460 RepID=A0A843UZU8_COLES|nr:hypothetical protein [Colocasia esculenta]
MILSPDPKDSRLDGGLLPLGASVPAAAPKQQPEAFNCATVLSGDPGSELTCNGASAAKRKPMHQYQSVGFLLPQQQLLRADDLDGDLALEKDVVYHSWLRAKFGASHTPYTNTLSCDSGMASTTGRSPAETQILPTVAVSSAATSLLSQQLVSQLHNQSHDIDDFIRLQNKRLRSELEQLRERHCRALLSAMQQGFLLHLRQKAAELESAKRRTAELEERVRQLVAENEIWLNVARNKEAIASSLRAGLEQALLKNASPAGAVVAPADLEEGYGDSGSVASTAPGVALEEMQSCFYSGEAAEGRRGKHGKCRVCSEGEVSVLVLPCRHLCLCDGCESRVTAACPQCKAAINATLHVFFG